MEITIRRLRLEVNCRAMEAGMVSNAMTRMIPTTRMSTTTLKATRYALLKQATGEGDPLAQGVRDFDEIVPIMRLDCRFTDRTSLELGVEGMPFFKERFLDHRDDGQSFSSQTRLGQVKMKGMSGGFNVFIVAGVEQRKKSYDDPGLPSESYVRGFFQVFIGEAVLAAAQ